MIALKTSKIRFSSSPKADPLHFTVYHLMSQDASRLEILQFAWQAYLRSHRKFYPRKWFVLAKEFCDSVWHHASTFKNAVSLNLLSYTTVGNGEKLTCLVLNQGMPHCASTHFPPMYGVSHVLAHPTELEPYAVNLPCYLNPKILSLIKMEDRVVYSRWI